MNRALTSGPIVWTAIIGVTCLLLVIFQTVLWLVLPLLLAVIAYFILSPLVVAAMAMGITRSRAVLMITLLMSVVLIALAFSVAPRISTAVHDLPAKLADYGQTGHNLIENAKRTLYSYFPFLAPRVTEPKALPVSNLGFVGTEVTPAPPPIPHGDDVENAVAAWQTKYSGDIALELLHWIPSLLLVPYVTYFLLLDGPRFKRFLVQAIPNAFFEKTLFLFYRVEDQIRRYFQGLIALTALDAICLGIGLWFLGLSSPFFFAGLAAVMAWLPYLGSLAGGLIVVLVAAHDMPSNYWLPYEVAGLFVGVRLLDDFVFLPLTVGRSLHMHPLLTVLMILLGGAVAGVSGLLLVMPVMGVVMVSGQVVGELLTDERILARHRHARQLKRLRAQAGLFLE